MPRTFPIIVLLLLVAIAAVSGYATASADESPSPAAPVADVAGAPAAADATAQAAPLPSKDFETDAIVQNPGTTISRVDAWRRDGKLWLVGAAVLLVLARLWLRFVAKPSDKPDPVGWRRYSIAIATAVVLVASASVDILAGPMRLDSLLAVLPAALFVLVNPSNPTPKQADAPATTA